MNKTIYIIIGLIVVGVVIWTVVVNQPGTPATSETGGQASVTVPITNSTTPETPTSSAASSSSGTSGPKSYTLVEVAKHSNQASCWTAINGGVYDLTNWVSQHPGGPDKILSICGKDGSAAFNTQHGGMQKQADILATFKIGTLAK